MKNILKYMVFGVMMVAIVACEDLYETHKKYLDMAEETYIGMADNLEANGGYKRVELRWTLNADPRISSCVITWNGSEEAVVVPVDRTQSVMSKIIDIPEGKYIFTIVVKSESGKESLAQTVSGESYGDKYREFLPQKAIRSFSFNPQGAVINWIAEENCAEVQLTYTDNNGVKKTISVDGNETTTWIKDFNHDYAEFEQTSIFRPEVNAFENISSYPVMRTFPAFVGYFILSKSDWEDNYHQQFDDLDHKGWDFEATTQELTGESPKPNGTLEALKDGLLTTYWHSQWQGATPSLPHIITMDMGKDNTITSIELARRSGNKDIKTVVYSISHDKESWTECGKVSYSNNANENALILLPGKPITGRYIRVTVTESHSSVHASIAEIFFTTSRKIE